MAFDDRPWEIIEAGPLADKEEMMGKIPSLAPGGGTEIYSSLEMAYDKLMDEKLQRKHIILLTDGQSNTYSNYEALIEEGKEKNITLSTVPMGNDADKNLLEDLAEFGTGRFYDVTDASVIPSVLSRETVMASRTYIEDNPFYPSIQDTPEWNGLFNDGCT
ncbi:VWA domain-containing protein [Peribacillus butanolivorans]|uniref:vWA domain-containing protein n=1 Tax=Peribacillus butanolivorans TaxID=421767 RepID=UPI0030C90864